MEQRTLLYDLEISPTRAWVWQFWQTDVIKKDKDWFLMSYSAHWLDTGETITKCLADYNYDYKDPHNDRELVKDLWELVNQADIVIGYNNIGFDDKKARTRFLVHRLPPPKPFKSLDILKEVRKHFGFISNKLTDVCEQLGIGKKVETGGAELWFSCMSGDLNAWQRMKTYNEHDVTGLLLPLYLLIRPWITNHPPTSDDVAECVCGGLLIKRGQQLLKGGRYRQRYQCQDCKKWTSGKLINPS